jgi:hypothetical protein
MAILDVLKEAGSVAIEVIKANPVVAGAAAVGVVATGYGAHRLRKSIKAKKATAALAAVPGVAVVAPVAATLTDAALLGLSYNQAVEQGVEAQWKAAVAEKTKAA